MKQKNYITCCLLLTFSLLTQAVSAQNKSFITTITEQNRWVDSVFRKLTRKEKIGQLFYVRAHTNRGKAYEDSVATIIRDEHIGGLVFFQGGPVRHANLINLYQKQSRVPLLIAMDGEWGLGMRLDSSVSYPYQMTLGAIQDNTLIYKMGQMVAYDFKRLGMHINFAPDMDVNNNPNNPVINYRSFGDNKYNVAKKGIAYFTGMQDAGVIVFAKHFPGHGDTNVDSHFALPQLPFTKGRLDSLEEYPFKQAIEAGISGVMIAHMNIPALDSTKNLPSTLSRPIVTGVLKDSLRFKGIVASDAMEMQGVVKNLPNGEADVRAFLAGNDLIELSVNSKNGAKLILKAIKKKQISKEEFDAKIRKLLAAKYWAGLANYKPVSPTTIPQDINRAAAAELIQQLADASVTVIKGSGQTIRQDPLKKTAIISIGLDKPTVFQVELSKWYPNSMIFHVDKNMGVPEMNRMLQVLKQYPQVFVSIHDTRTRPASKLDYSNNVKLLISELAAKPNTVMSLFGNPYTIAGLPGIEKSTGIIVGYQKEDAMQRSAVKVITGLIKPAGKLPVSVNAFFPTGTGVSF
ncbi:MULTISPECIES: glycoside hydrolase family 3 N-terminal domain-containing protein [unclassified Mucilaginibacter]|uniref:glycoside hydrolase family 3 protein n=1 Tax=unclassified Mucilaginibacter TaxID=2617802 RepID=UPI002AC8BF4C|nr:MULTISPECIES: glycoside hydrolase family 3 N-terminal domain-containing protein [unclassified Mucilaginibacter]MEB0262770.1 glycoside hydrolase family 3 N-terminal domain-containing protein [Mucilaginibacter sp. 10I4]MEB0280196.1 glycoside hydrolase family 3 N-terminal domain-containing protein [Mucilaginibacter sp. 10B2]MEB0302933.1 glycoside hydrolase family 3 N-terminal domain-containing protein [Mucilaginibacter sp. 5C4]WPX24395.1 glycoside hydrolase family 3 N-terminal domain-containing